MIPSLTTIHLLHVFLFFFPYPHMDVFHLFSLGGPQDPCVPALWMPPGKWVPRLSFPSRAFCTFNHVTLSRADYSRLSSLEKVRAGIRASWGIRSPNWFQLSLPSNDQFFSHIDGAVGLYVRRRTWIPPPLPLSCVFFWTSMLDSSNVIWNCCLMSNTWCYLRDYGQLFFFVFF